MTTPDANAGSPGAAGSANERMLAATMLGYVSGVSGHGYNPYHYMQAEAWCWEHGREQGRQHRCRCDAHPPNAERSATAGAAGAENTQQR